MSPPTKGAGILLRLYKAISEPPLDPKIDVPGACITKITTISSTDDKVKSGASSAGFLYHVKHISRFLLDGAYKNDPAYFDDPGTSVDWLVYKRISELSRGGHEDTTPPGSVMICVAITPKDADNYSNWYEEEHQGMITRVPGWRKSERYELAQAFGSETGAAPFLAVHLYDEENGLGGVEWKASVDTEWSKKIREDVIVPHYRRVWKVVEQTNVC
ncbi:hypothetical protein N431DRAFT_437705 [Stipitochalara longipes BDJ]|nr:hypothetical protein N431DRAFT_437705 [Stipitochalara longipes BDJ]